MHTEQFITERMYLNGVASSTVGWYRSSFKAFEGAMESKEAMVSRIAQLRKTNSAISVNSYLRAINAYLHWRDGKGDKCSPQCTHLHIPKLKEEENVLTTLSAAQVQRLTQAAHRAPLPFRDPTPKPGDLYIEHPAR